MASSLGPDRPAYTREIPSFAKNARADVFERAKKAAAEGRLARATTLLEQALQARPEQPLRSEIVHFCMQLGTGDPLDTSALLLTEAAPVAERDRALAVDMLSQAALLAHNAGAVENGRAIAARASDLAVGLSREGRAAADFAVGVCDLLSGDSRQGEQLILASVDHLEPHLARVVAAGASLYWIEEYERAREALARTVEKGRKTNDPFLPNSLDTLAAIDFRTGRWSAGRALSAEALRLATEYGQAYQIASCHTTLARFAAARGREAVCRRHAGRALEMVGDSDFVFGWASSALGLLELGLGRINAVVEVLNGLVTSPAGELRSDPAMALARADLVEAHVRSGTRNLAERQLVDFEELFGNSARVWARAALARCRGLLADVSDFDRHFTDALEILLQKPTPFDRARVELAYGERLRRSRRRADARVQLQSAAATFERLGARPWADRARAEMRATGGTRSAGIDFLTPREREVASLVSRGLTNREAATALFVTPKAIEYHLSNIYGKLGVRSRTQLAVFIQRQQL